VSDLREQLTRLANRGAPRGAEAVLDAAVRDARRGASNRAGGAAPLTTMDGDDAPVVGLHERRRNRSPFRSSVAAAGIAALVGVTFVAVAAIGSGGGGASSPDGAVRKLAEAITAEDSLAAINVLAPDEVRTLRNTVDAAQSKAADVKLVERASAPFAGLDVRVDDLALANEDLADGFVKVHLTAGTISAETNRSEFSRVLQRATEDDGNARASADFARSHPFDYDPFVVAVRRDGKWYVSAAYTALEYVRLANHLAPADYGSADAATLGADSPEAAVRELTDAIVAAQWEKAFSLLPPDEAPLYDYRTGLAQLLGNDFEATVTSFDAKASVDGDKATVSVTAAGTYRTSDTEEKWNVSDMCLRQTYSYYESDGSAPTSQWTGTCLADHGVLPVEFFGPPIEPGGPAQVQTVRRDGRWFVSPVGTALDVLDDWVANFDERTLATMFDDFSEIPADGTLTLGEPIAVKSTGGVFGLAVVYAFEGTAGQEVIADLSQNRREYVASGVVIDPDGKELEASGGLASGVKVRLPVSGTYKLVLRYVIGDTTLTLWDAKNAPAGVIDDTIQNDYEDCIGTTAPLGGTTVSCSGSGSAFPGGEDRESVESGTTATTHIATPDTTAVAR
jgi:hypothetical protein